MLDPLLLLQGLLALITLELFECDMVGFVYKVLGFHQGKDALCVV